MQLGDMFTTGKLVTPQWTQQTSLDHKFTSQTRKSLLTWLIDVLGGGANGLRLGSVLPVLLVFARPDKKPPPSGAPGFFTLILQMRTWLQ